MAREEQVKVLEKFITYVGLSDARIIREEDWKTIGIQGPKIRWDKTNGFKIRVTQEIPREVLEYCQHDRELVVTEE